MHSEQGCAGPARSTRLVRHKKQVHNQRFGLNFDASKALKLPVLSLNTAINSSTAHTLSFPLSNSAIFAKVSCMLTDGIPCKPMRKNPGSASNLGFIAASSVTSQLHQTNRPWRNVACFVEAQTKKLPGRAAVSVS